MNERLRCSNVFSCEWTTPLNNDDDDESLLSMFPCCSSSSTKISSSDASMATCSWCWLFVWRELDTFHLLSLRSHRRTSRTSHRRSRDLCSRHCRRSDRSPLGRSSCTNGNDTNVDCRILSSLSCQCTIYSDRIQSMTKEQQIVATRWECRSDRREDKHCLREHSPRRPTSVSFVWKSCSCRWPDRCPGRMSNNWMICGKAKVSFVGLNNSSGNRMRKRWEVNERRVRRSSSFFLIKYFVNVSRICLNWSGVSSSSLFSGRTNFVNQRESSSSVNELNRLRLTMKKRSCWIRLTFERRSTRIASRPKWDKEDRTDREVLNIARRSTERNARRDIWSDRDRSDRWWPYWEDWHRITRRKICREMNSLRSWLIDSDWLAVSFTWSFRKVQRLFSWISIKRHLSSSSRCCWTSIWSYSRRHIERRSAGKEKRLQSELEQLFEIRRKRHNCRRRRYFVGFGDRNCGQYL